MLPEKQVTFKQVDNDESVPEWSRVRLNDDVRLIAMKEVCLLWYLFALGLMIIIYQASNGVLYMIDGTVKLD